MFDSKYFFEKLVIIPHEDDILEKKRMRLVKQIVVYEDVTIKIQTVEKKPPR